MSLHVGAQRLRFAAVISLEASDACVTCRGGQRSEESSRQKLVCLLDSLAPYPASHRIGSAQYNKEQDRWTAHRCEDDDVRQP